MDLIVVFVMVVERSRGMVSEVFGRRLVSRVLISQVLLLPTGGGGGFTFINFTLPTQVGFLYISFFLHESRPAQVMVD